MDRTYILHRIYTSENSAEHRDTQLSEMYPDVAGTKEAVEKALNRRIEDAKAKGFTVEEISSEDVHKGHYFDRVIKIQQPLLWNFICLDSLLILFAAMDTKYNDYRRVDNRYTTAIGMSSWRFFNIGKYKNQKVKDVCYFNPFYVAWCLENWQGFSLTGYERSNYMKGLERQLEKDPEDQELILKVSKCKTIA